ncbi:MAG: T9SS type A sorting domain-containing protein [Bacteroidota bacterium]|nr:T9SS type A sorting domain-containing protein [Bacteroidota bacterium]
MKSRLKYIFIGIVLVLQTSSILFSQSKQITWSTFSMGFETSTSSTRGIKSVIGQTFVDESQQSTKQIRGGFLADTLLQKLIFTRTIKVAEAWNLLSVPVITKNYNKKYLFPTAISSAFNYKGSYNIVDSLENGMGYWLKYPFIRNIDIVGEGIVLDTIDVSIGWNILGSISYPVPTNNIISIPGNMIVSRFFCYDVMTSQYMQSDTIKPGYGYWVKVNQDGKLILLVNPGGSLAKRIRIIPTSELPPSPPSENGEVIALPKEYALEQNYPNPFNPVTTLKYGLPFTSDVRLKIYNTLGQLVATLVDEIQEAGYKSVDWNSSNIASGVYFYRLEAMNISNPSKSFTKVKKMLLLR